MADGTDPAAEPVVYPGGCACGAVRFAYTCGAATPPVFSAMCHCALCRKGTAAAAVHLLGVPPAALAVTQGADNLATFAPTPAFERKFCRTCGVSVCQVGGAARGKAAAAAAVVVVAAAAMGLTRAARPGPQGRAVYRDVPDAV